VLARLPALRSSAVQRPGQIVFGANDIESSQPERDGYDTFGLLLDRRNSTGGPWYVFVVGSLERRDYRPVSVADIRVVAMSVKDGATLWETGFGDTAALAKYRQGLDPEQRCDFRPIATNSGWSTARRGLRRGVGIRRALGVVLQPCSRPDPRPVRRPLSGVPLVHAAAMDWRSPWADVRLGRDRPAFPKQRSRVPPGLD
jgi:hypothetical protein